MFSNARKTFICKVFNMAKCFEKLMFWKRNTPIANFEDCSSDSNDSDNYTSVHDKEQKLISLFGPDSVHLENLPEVKITSMVTLGDGAFSVVKKCFSEQYDDFVAVKIIKLDEENTSSYVEKFLPVEIKLWSKLSSRRNQNILNLFESIRCENFQYLVTEYASKGDLNDFLSYGTLSEYKAKSMFKDIARAVSFCHSMGIAHRDIKPDNILISQTGQLKLADFSFVTDSNPVIWERCGTPRMLAPEQTTLASYNPFLSDVWQVGMTLYLMVFRKHPFESTKKNDILNELKTSKDLYKNVPFPKKMVSINLKNLLCGMLNVESSNRYDIQKVENSAWLLE